MKKWMVLLAAVFVGLALVSGCNFLDSSDGNDGGCEPSSEVSACIERRTDECLCEWTERCGGRLNSTRRCPEAIREYACKHAAPCSKEDD